MRDDIKVFYFSRDNTGKIAPFKESEVIKNEVDNQPPSDFGFVYPPDGANTSVVLNIDWEDVETSEGETVTYTFQISTSVDFVNDLVYEQTGLLVSNAVVDSSAGLKDGVTYYWRAIAVDSKGGVTYIARPASRLQGNLIARSPGTIAPTANRIIIVLNRNYLMGIRVMLRVLFLMKQLKKILVMRRLL